VKFVADESVDKPIVDAMRSNNYEVYYILEDNSGIPDHEVLNIANSKKSVLLTADKDFGELVFRQKKNHQGIVLFRLAGLNNEQKVETVIKMLKQYHLEIKDHFSVISRTHIRIVKF
jgi:predicted nuclease of predicted toxin-antitoxin system